MMMEYSDSQLAVMAGRGDADAYRRLFERYQHPVYNFVYRMVDNAEDASDIVQDAFIKVYNALAAQKDVLNFSAYLYMTAKNLAYDEMRRRTRFADVDHELLAPEDPNIYADPQRALLLGEQIEKVRKAADGLNENQRAALVLKELEGLNYDEMSEIMESNRNAIGALLSRARLKFREELRMAQVPTDQVPEECESIIALLSPYIDGELAADQVGHVESHLEQCTFCSAALEEMEEASRSFRMLIPVIPPVDMAEAFTGRLEEAMQAGPGKGAEDGPVQMEETAAQVPPGRSLFARIARHRVTLIAAAIIAAVGLSAFLLADQAGRDSVIVEAILGEEEVEPQPEMDFPSIPEVDPADPVGIVLQEEEPSGEEQVPGEQPRPEGPGDESQPGGESATGKILSGSASPNPVYEDNPLTITVSVSGHPDSVSVNIAGAMTVPLSRQSSGGTEVWRWSGLAPGYGSYSMTATATYPSGPVSKNLGTLTVLYYLY